MEKESDDSEGKQRRGRRRRNENGSEEQRKGGTKKAMWDGGRKVELEVEARETEAVMPEERQGVKELNGFGFFLGGGRKQTKKKRPKLV